jgi:hypothetical protein
LFVKEPRTSLLCSSLEHLLRLLNVFLSVLDPSQSDLASDKMTSSIGILHRMLGELVSLKRSKERVS